MLSIHLVSYLDVFVESFFNCGIIGVHKLALEYVD